MDVDRASGALMLNERIRIKDWKVDPAAGVLENGATVRRVDRKAMEVLCFLASKPGKAVTKAELFEVVWKGGAVSEDVLTGAISVLRKALGDSSRNPRYIRTLPKVGYALMTPVRREKGDYLAPERRRGQKAAVLGAVVLVLSGAVVAWHRSEGFTAREEAPALPRIAVLPFADRSPSAGESYLADALAEAMITRLARGGGVRVLAWRTARNYKGKDALLSDLAGELGVDAVLEGSVDTDGSRLRLHARFVDGPTGDHLWAETYDRPLDDVLAVQEDLARRVTAAIRSKLGLPAPGASRIPRTEAISPRAYRELLKGRYFRHRETEGDLHRAADHFRRAIALEPAFAEAHAALAETYFLQTEGKGLSRPDGLELGAAAAAEALRLDPNLGAAHAADAIVKFCLAWRFEEADRSFRAFLDRNPQDPVSLEWYTRFLTVTGRFDEALVQWRAIAELDPASYSDLAPIRILIFARRYDEALRRLAEAEELDPDDVEVRRLYAFLFDLLGQEDAAVAAHLRVLSLVGWSADRIREVEAAYRTSGAPAVSAIFEQSVEAPVEKAALRLRTGDREGALRLLEEAYAARDRNLPWINVHPAFDDLRGEPRFAALLGRLGLPAAL